MRSIVRALVTIGCLTIVGCSSHLAGVKRAFADLKGSSSVGVSYLDFIKKLQDVAGSIEIAKQEGASTAELRPYVDALAIYLRSQALWKQKIDCPAAFGHGDPNGCLTDRIFHDIRDLASQYNVAFDSMDEAAIKSYEAEVAVYEGKLAKVVNNGKSGYDTGLFRPPPYALQRVNGHIFDSLISAMWQKAERIQE